MINKHGAEWVRADFHLHTIKDFGASRKRYRDEFVDCDDRFTGAFIDKLEQEGIRVAAITNHNTFDIGEFKCLEKKGRKKGILILPGVELGMRGGNSTIHALVIFDPANLRTDNNFINQFLTRVFQKPSPDEGTATDGDMADCFSRLENLHQSYFVVFAHIESDNGILKEMTKTGLEPIHALIGADTWARRVLGFQGVKSDIKYIAQKLPDGVPIPAFVDGSDPETSLSEVGRVSDGHGLCFLKLGELSYHSVRFALRDHPIRVKREQPAISATPRIHSIGIDDGKRTAVHYPLSCCLNTLIGSRGSGKSLMIEALRWCLGEKAGEGDKTYKDSLIHAFLDKGATVKVAGITADGKEFEISRSYTNKKEQPPPEISVNGEKVKISRETVLPGLLYFGQKDLGQREEEATKNIFTQLLPAIPDELKRAADNALDEFETAIDTYLTSKKAEDEDGELKFEEANLTEKLDKFKKAGIEDRLKEITSFDEDHRRLKELHKSLQDEYKTLTDSFCAEADKASWDGILQSQHNEDLKPELATLGVSYDAARASVKTGLDEFKKVLEGVVSIGKQLNEKRQEKQEVFAQILRDVDQPDLDIDSYRKMVSRLQQIKETRAKTKEKKGKSREFRDAVIEKGRAWHKALEAIHTVQLSHIDEINTRLPKEINIRQSFQGDKEKYREFLKDKFAGTGFTEPSYEALVSGTNHGLDLFIRYDAIMKTELSQKMGEKFDAKLQENFKDMLTFSPPDYRLIQYEGTKISELSLGKRAMALLLLLLSLDKHPIIILDQPEDDLDNETIHNFIVKPLVKNKDRIQFIIATHNPNIPVLGDADQVIACYEEGKGQHREDFGSLDMTKTKDAIINIMEGGSKAFEKRHDIYTLWAKPH